MAKLHVKRKDLVMILSGKERGSRQGKTKRGRVLKVIPEKDQVIVERLNFIKRHTRPSASHRQGGIVEKEGAIHVSNVMVICPKCDEPTRISMIKGEDGKSIRICKHCGEPLDK